MHPFHRYLTGQLDKLLRERRVVVFYDPRRGFEPFIDELRPLEPADGVAGCSGSRSRILFDDGLDGGLRAKKEPSKQAT